MVLEELEQNRRCTIAISRWDLQAEERARDSKGWREVIKQDYARIDQSLFART